MVKIKSLLRSRAYAIGAMAVVAAIISFVAIAFSLSPSTKVLGESIRKSRREGKADAAWKLTLQLLSEQPTDVSSWKLIADMADETGDAEIAVTGLQELVQIDAAQAGSYWVRIASIEMSRNKAIAADAALEAALAVEPNSTGALRLKAQLAGVLGRSEELAHLLLRLIQQRAFTQGDLVVLASSDPFVADEDRIAALKAADSEDYQLLLPQAKSAINANRADEAKKSLTMLLEHLPQHWEAQGLLGQILSTEEGDQFLKWQQSLPAEADTNPRIWLARGLWLEKRGETRSAARCFHEALKLEPELLMAISHLGQCVRLNGEQKIADQFAARASLLLRVRDLATRIDEQHSLQWAPELIGCLEKLGQNWEAWAWSTLVSQANPINPGWKQQVVRLEQQLSECVTRTDPAALPAQHLDWSLVSLPDWSTFTQSAAPLSVDASDGSIEFRDDAALTGLNFTYRNKVNSGESGNLIYESTGGGVAVIDVDADSWPDLYFVQGGSLHDPRSSPMSDSLFRNRRGLKFLDVTADSGLVENSYGQGVAAGDINNDGFADLYVANIGENRLMINNGDGTFSFASEALPTEPRWTISTAIADLNNDGNPELVDVNYCEGRTPLTTVCVTEKQTPRACRPTIFEPAPDIQLTNNGDGTFIAHPLTSDETSPGGRGMGVVVADFDDDKRVDMFVANDQSPNHLLLNLATTEGSPPEFREEGLLRGVGLDREGFALAFMGIAHGDVNRDGQLDMFVTTFSQETPTLFLSQPGGQFSDSTREAGLRAPCFSMLGFGTQFVDADNDGLLDLLILNGHIDQFTDSGQQYQMRPQCFRGLPESKFVELPSTSAGEFFATPRLGRALALLDWNKDHQLDFVATDLEQAAALGTNVSKSQGKAIRFRCVGVVSSRDAVGAKVQFSVADGQQSVQQITAGDGYEASSDRTLHLAIGRNDQAENVSIEWSSGATSEFQNVSSSHAVVAIEGRTVAYKIPL